LPLKFKPKIGAKELEIQQNLGYARGLLMHPLFFLALLPLFIPPSNWECKKPKDLSSYVQVGFIGKGSSSFHPSINFAKESVTVSLKEYVKAVKKIHSTEPQTSWRDLGKFKMKAGEGRLTEITTASPYGNIKMLQALFVQDATAYILTGAALAKEFAQFQNEFLSTFRSFSLISDLFDPLTQGKKEQFDALFATWDNVLEEEAREKEWLTLQKAITRCPEMGTHWNFLVLEKGHTKIFQK
jgi:hypothetical protein